jgi:hypothetical protein
MHNPPGGRGTGRDGWQGCLRSVDSCGTPPQPPSTHVVVAGARPPAPAESMDGPSSASRRAAAAEHQAHVWARYIFKQGGCSGRVRTSAAVATIACLGVCLGVSWGHTTQTRSHTACHALHKAHQAGSRGAHTHTGLDGTLFYVPERTGRTGTRSGRWGSAGRKTGRCSLKWP